MYVLKALTFVAAILGGFAYIAQQIPQEVSMPPTEQSFDATKVKTVDDIKEIGQGIFFGKGQCALCHALGGGTMGRCPNLGGDNPVGRKLNRAFEYETYTNPEAYVYMDYTSSPPKSFPARMPQINKLPIGLSEAEMATVFAFLQGVSGKIEVTPEEVIALSQSKKDGAAPAVEMAITGNAELGKAVYAKVGCAACHKAGEGEGGDKGPNLADVVKNKSMHAVQTAVFEDSPAHAAEAYAEKVTVKEMKDLIAYLASFRTKVGGAS